MLELFSNSVHFIKTAQSHSCRKFVITNRVLVYINYNVVHLYQFCENTTHINVVSKHNISLALRIIFTQNLGTNKNIEMLR